ncbi:hypothetical protein G6F62_012884 [Rhizopus arrhizus]|nr:hypothetical protein G6F62_012884 [Rhizopus arrhizus]
MAMERHHRDVAGHAPPTPRRRLLQVRGALGLLASLLASITAWGAAQGFVARPSRRHARLPVPELERSIHEVHALWRPAPERPRLVARLRRLAGVGTGHCAGHHRTGPGDGDPAHRGLPGLWHQHRHQAAADPA